MTKLKAIIPALLLTTTSLALSWAGDQINIGERRYSIDALRADELLPPEQFDRPYTGILTIKRGTQADVRAVCPIKPERPAIACAIWMLGGDTCTIYIANDIVLQAYGWNYAIALRHETGHCNGWRHSEKYR